MTSQVTSTPFLFMRLLIFVFFLLFVISCQKEPITCEVPECNQDSIPGKDSMKLLWESVINPNGNTSFADLYLQDDHLIINNNFNTPSANILYFDTTSREVKWEWKERISDKYHTFNIDNENIYIKDGRELFSINIPSGTTQWAFRDTVELASFGSLIGDNYYLGAWPKASGDRSISSFRRINNNNGVDWEELISFDRADFDNFTIFFQSPNLWMDPNTNDSILIIPVRMVEFDRNLRRSDLIAYNLNTREIVWQVEDFTGIVSVDQPIIHNGHVYVKNTREIFAFNLMDGSLAWKYTETNQWANYGGGRLQVIDNKLILGEISGSVVYALDPITGSVIWRHEKDFGFATCKSDIIHYKSYIIISNFDKLDVFDVRDGTHVHKIRLTVRRFRGRMALDEANRKLYVPEDSQIVAYELPEEF